MVSGLCHHRHSRHSGLFFRFWFDIQDAWKLLMPLSSIEEGWEERAYPKIKKKNGRLWYGKKRPPSAPTAKQLQTVCFGFQFRTRQTHVKLSDLWISNLGNGLAPGNRGGVHKGRRRGAIPIWRVNIAPHLWSWAQSSEEEPIARRMKPECNRWIRLLAWPQRVQYTYIMLYVGMLSSSDDRVHKCKLLMSVPTWKRDRFHMSINFLSCPVLFSHLIFNVQTRRCTYE